MNDKELSALKALAEAATPGPWFVQQGDDYNFMNMTAISTEDRGTRHLGQLTDDNLLAVTFHQSQPWVACELDDLGDANSAYIAAANPAAILSLISHVESADLLGEHYEKLCQSKDARIAELEADKEGWRKAAIGQASFATPARDVGGLTESDARNRVVAALGIIENGLNEGRSVIYSWDYLLNTIRALATSPAPSVKQEANDLVMIAHLIGIIYFAGDFKAETANERELEALLVKTGHRYASWQEVDDATQNLAAPSASQGEVKVPDGFAIVPINPTPEMCNAPNTVIQAYGARLVYERMLAAAPAPSVMDGEEK